MRTRQADAALLEVRCPWARIRRADSQLAWVLPPADVGSRFTSGSLELVFAACGPSTPLGKGLLRLHGLASTATVLLSRKKEDGDDDGEAGAGKDDGDSAGLEPEACSGSRRYKINQNPSPAPVNN